jgi:hypothetical protein
MDFFKKYSEVLYRFNFDKKNKVDIRTLIIEKNSRDKYDKKFHNRIITTLIFCLAVGLFIALL